MAQMSGFPTGLTLSGAPCIHPAYTLQALGASRGARLPRSEGSDAESIDGFGERPE